MDRDTRVKEVTKATRETKGKGGQMELMDARVIQDSLVFPAVKDLQDQMAHRENLVQREILVPMEPKQLKVSLEGMEKLGDQGTMALQVSRETWAHEEPMGTKESGVMMAHQDLMDHGEMEVRQERRVSKVPVVTGAQKEMKGIQGLEESLAERVHLALMEIQVSLGRQGHQGTEEMRAHLDQRDLKDQEESKELLETEA